MKKYEKIWIDMQTMLVYNMWKRGESLEENKYTVSDVARKVHMTERTIRNYLKDGILKGTRVGGQWRFSDQDLIDLSNNSIFRKKVSDIASSYAKEYIDKKFVIEGDVTVCSIIDYKNSDQK